MKSILQQFLFFILMLPFLACNSQNKQTSEIKKDTVHLTFLPQEDEYDFYISGNNHEHIIDDETRFIDGNKFGIEMKPKGDYNHLKASIITQRKQFKQKFLAASTSEVRDSIINQAAKYVSETLVNNIFPFWYGMPWDMSGYSEIPQEGEVGCSYFVSNTLKHCGFKVNRYRLAQQNTKNIGLSIQLPDSLLILKGNNEVDMIKNYFVNNKKEGLYYVGLDCHVGFLLHKMGEVFFIQSNYGTPVEVLIEYSNKSKVFTSSRYYIADITYNNELIRKWILNEEIKVVRE